MVEVSHIVTSRNFLRPRYGGVLVKANLHGYYIHVYKYSMQARKHMCA